MLLAVVFSFGFCLSLVVALCVSLLFAWVVAFVVFGLCVYVRGFAALLFVCLRLCSCVYCCCCLVWCVCFVWSARCFDGLLWFVVFVARVVVFVAARSVCFVCCLVVLSGWFCLLCSRSVLFDADRCFAVGF